jgi:hypothetical protein
VAPGGDTRSGGEGAGLVGQPFLVAVAVVALGLASAFGTVIATRLAARRAKGGPR